jgi:hypothetical protein
MNGLPKPDGMKKNSIKIQSRDVSFGNPDEAISYLPQAIFINHENDPSTAIEKVEEEIKKGTKYFFSTMSKVNVRLSGFFTGEADDDGNKIDDKNNPILVCTATSSYKVQTKKNKVYRYYPRSKEEGEQLAMVLNDLSKTIKIEKASAIILDSNHGTEAVEAFKENLVGIVYDTTHEVKVSFGMSKDDVFKTVEAHKTDLSDKKLAILISHYGQGITDIMTSLKELVLAEKVNVSGKEVWSYKNKEALPLFLFSSTLKSETWQKPIEDILKQIRYRIAVPQYDKKSNKHADVVKDFSEFTFTKFIKSIIMVKNGRKKDFHSAWKSINTPDDLVKNREYVRDKKTGIENGDTKIYMTIDDENINK